MSPMRAAPLPPSAVSTGPSNLTKSMRLHASSLTTATSRPNIATHDFPYQTDISPNAASRSPSIHSNTSTSTSAEVHFPRDKSIRAAFTEIHNSQQFGQGEIELHPPCCARNPA
jgi:hypothetical protein